MFEKIRDLMLRLFWGPENAAPPEDAGTVYAPDGKHRVVLVRRADGAWFFREELFNDKLLDMRWEPGRTGPAEGCATREDALAAARKALSWFWTVQD